MSCQLDAPVVMVKGLVAFAGSRMLSGYPITYSTLEMVAPVVGDIWPEPSVFGSFTTVKPSGEVPTGTWLLAVRKRPVVVHPRV